MASTYWISISDQMRLTTVQAGIQVNVAVLCALGIFVFSRFCWQLSILRVAQNRAVTLSSLISINTIGEVGDALWLLRLKMFRRKYWRLLSQSFVVLLLTVAAIISGPIAKASTRLGTTIRSRPEPGLLANRGFNQLANVFVQWNQTATSLDQAGFPYDQLLDYLPNTNLSWVYRPDEWNATWTMRCNKTGKTSVRMYDTGNCTDVYSELPGLNSFFPEDSFAEAWGRYTGIYVNSTWMSDVLVVLGGWAFPGYDNISEITHNMTVSFAAVELHNLYRSTNDSSTCWFGQGAIESAAYTKIQCALQRRETVPNAFDVAFPDHAGRTTVVQAYVMNFAARLLRESASGAPITGITTDELIRFYQTYLIVKDTWTQMPVTRNISMNLRVVQLSLTALILLLLLALLDIIGLANYAWFTWKHWDDASSTPRSKLDWAVQSITDVTSPIASGRKNSYGRHSVVAAPAPEPHVGTRNLETVRHFFETARYGNHAHENDESIPLHKSSGAIYISQSEVQTPEQSLYNTDPFEAQYASQDYTTGHVGHNLQAPQSHVYAPYSSRGYSPLA